MTNQISMQEVEMLFDILDAIGTNVKNRILASGINRLPDFETFGGYFMGVISDMADRKPPYDNEDVASALMFAYNITSKKLGTNEQSRIWRTMAVDIYEQMGGKV